MKTRLLLLLALITGTQLFAQGGNSCNNLFITELYIEKNPNNDSATQFERPFDLNYAVEIFNPKQVPVDLTHYALDLQIGTSVTTIPLSGMLSGGDVYVVSNQNCGLNLELLSDTLTPYLDFENATILTLRHNGVALDKIGQDGIPTADSFDMVQFVANPFDYLNNYHLDLNDYQNIDVRRTLFATKGDTTMQSSIELLGNWAFFPEGDMSDIGHYTGVCNKTASQDIIGFWQSFVGNAPNHFVFSDAIPTMIDSLDLLVNSNKNGVPSNTGIQLQLNGFPPNPPSSNVTLNNDVDIARDTSCTSNVGIQYIIPSHSSSLSQPTNCIHATYNYSGFPSLNTMAILSPKINRTTGNFSFIHLSVILPTSGVTIDPARHLHYMYIARTVSIGETVTAAPTFIASYTTTDLSIQTTSTCLYTIVDAAGRKHMNGIVDERTKKIATSYLPAGLYLIQFYGQNIQPTVKKFVKL